MCFPENNLPVKKSLYDLHQTTSESIFPQDLKNLTPEIFNRKKSDIIAESKFYFSINSCSLDRHCSIASLER